MRRIRYLPKSQFKRLKMKIAILGLGLIGGSIALELKTRSLGTIEVLGVDTNENHQKEAVARKLVDGLVTEEEAFAKAEIILLATPVNSIKKNLWSYLDKINSSQVIIDMGSTKRHICHAVTDHIKRSRYVAAHPLAGTEFSGPKAAHLDLFKGKKSIICESEKSDKNAMNLAIKIFDFLGMQILYLSPEEHDKHMAYVSHLSHISSFTLSLTVQEIEKDEKQIFNLASTGFESTARLAKSNANTWGPIFEANSEYLLEAIDMYIDNLNKFRKSLTNHDQEGAKSLMLKANDISRVLDGINFKN